MHDYPLLNLFLTFVYFFIWILWIFLIVRIIGDVFRSSDLSGGGKALWTLLLIVLPFFGVLLYLIMRGTDMHTRENRHAMASEAAIRHYLTQPVNGAPPSIADELTKLAALRDQGVINAAEFEAQKVKLLA